MQSSEWTNTDLMPNGTVGTECHCSDEYPCRTPKCENVIRPSKCENF